MLPRERQGLDRRRERAARRRAPRRGVGHGRRAGARPVRSIPEEGEEVTFQGLTVHGRGGDRPPDLDGPDHPRGPRTTTIRSRPRSRDDERERPTLDALVAAARERWIAAPTRRTRASTWAPRSSPAGRSSPARTSRTPATRSRCAPSATRSPMAVDAGETVDRGGRRRDRRRRADAAVRRLSAGAERVRARRCRSSSSPPTAGAGRVDRRTSFCPTRSDRTTSASAERLPERHRRRRRPAERRQVDARERARRARRSRSSPTSRRRPARDIRAILSTDEAQIVFTDTPGVPQAADAARVAAERPRRRRGRRRRRRRAGRRRARGRRAAATRSSTSARCAPRRAPQICVVNKVDAFCAPRGGPAARRGAGARRRGTRSCRSRPARGDGVDRAAAT